VSTLPFIDQHDAQIAAPAEQVWAALVASVSRFTPQLPRWLVVAWGLEPAGRSRSSNGALAVGDSVAGFTTAAIDPGHALALRGRHRFAEYELRFELEPLPTGDTRLRAQTNASFPGLKGALYRALVIGSGGHRVAVRRILARIGSRAESTGASGSAD
jgi:uncharacterized protein YndB with AHSA1/START domain